jgi:hypothetical protein
MNWVKLCEALETMVLVTQVEALVSKQLSTLMAIVLLLLTLAAEKVTAPIALVSQGDRSHLTLLSAEKNTPASLGLLAP